MVLLGNSEEANSSDAREYLESTDLLPTLEASAGETRVVTTSSSAHAFATEMGLDDPAYSGESNFDTNSNYGRAKFANMLFAQELAQRTRSSGVRSIATHPGVVLTTLFKELGPDYQASSGGSGLRSKSAVEDRLDGIPALRTIREATPLKLVLKSPEEGCRPLLYSLLAPGLPSGGYDERYRASDSFGTQGWAWGIWTPRSSDH